MFVTTRRHHARSIKLLGLTMLAVASIATGEQYGLKVQVAAGGLQVQPDSRGAAAISAEDAQWLGQTGEPRLPWRVGTVMLPPDAAMETVTLVEVGGGRVEGFVNLRLDDAAVAQRERSGLGVSG